MHRAACTKLVQDSSKPGQRSRARHKAYLSYD
ncbi:hypothetical protein C8J25_104187 [Sphingomonas faeni]|uniref:Uncharacterized protein n=1 Tax=Sphingomonas faeni TaxID=185950 RepID=A0A2T5U5R9_9SPHN|nr:hypothetical protein C8J25_104187 [Sphingomonas faeni]